MQDWKPPHHGMDAPSFVRFLAGLLQPEDELFFKVYKPSRGIADRFGVEPARAFFGMTADELWRASGCDIAKMVRHIVGGAIADTENLDGKLAREIAWPSSLFVQSVGADEVVAVCSKVRAAGRDLHWPMLDFRAEIPAERESAERLLEILCKSLKAIGALGGVVMESGNSYHYYGYEPVEPNVWRRFMQRSLLLEPFIDVRYIAHRLESGHAALRVTAARDKPHVPHVVAWV